MSIWDPGTKLRFGAACVIALVAGWSVHDRAIAPLKQKKAEALLAATEMTTRADEAQGTIDGIAARLQAARGRGSEMERMKSELPAGSAMVWLPPMVRGHFERFGIATPEIRLNTIRDEPHIAGCERGFWFVRLPIDEGSANMATLLLGVEELDRRNPFLRVLDLSIRPDPDDGKRRIAVVNLGILSPKTGDSR